MKKLILGSALAVMLFLTASTIPALGAVEEPWSEIEARTKFLRTKHYIETIRVHSDAYSSAKAKGGKEVPGPFPVHVILPEDYEKNVNHRYGVVYLLGGKSGWDNGPELGGATYWSVWCKTPLAMDNLKSGQLTKASFQDNVGRTGTSAFQSMAKRRPVRGCDSRLSLESWRRKYRPVREVSDRRGYPLHRCSLSDGPGSAVQRN